MVQAIQYRFVQKFQIPARKAYEWCTDYAPSDMALMREQTAIREIRRISSDTVILKDTFIVEGKPIVKEKLVCLYPDQMTWTSTHLTGPNKYSQFLYEITSQSNEQSCLTFTALSLDYDVTTMDKAEKLARELNRMDSENWSLLAKRMEEDLN